MKSNIIFFLTAVMCFITFSALCCYRIRQDARNINKIRISHGVQVDTKVVLIEGHKYIILDADYGANIIHAESCNCKSK